MLGELYRPSGPALETARAVLQVDDPFACNVAWGCTNNCYDGRCYNKKRIKTMRFPKKPPIELIKQQLKQGLDLPEGVFLSFGTDPFLKANRTATLDLITYLTEQSSLFPHSEIKIATLSKMDLVYAPLVINGMTIASSSEAFTRQHEPNTCSVDLRIQKLSNANSLNCPTWVSVEPYPPPTIWNQDLTELLKRISFVDFLIFGKLNHDKRGSTPKARDFYREAVPEFIDFCKSHGIRSHVKSGTLKFIEAR